MKKQYQAPLSFVHEVKIETILNDQSPEDTPIGGGDPDARHRGDTQGKNFDWEGLW